MPHHKRQHYGPQCYFRPFSVDGNGATINLFNIRRSMHVPDAGIRGQCARDYFYGKDIVIEKWLKLHEDEYSTAVSRVILPRRRGKRDLSILMDFAYLQYSRTEIAMKRRQDLEKEQLSAIYEGRPVAMPDIDMTDSAVIQSSMLAYIQTRKTIDDLKACIIRNDTDIAFVTSDDPAVLVNRFYSQRLSSNNFGIGSSGVCIFMPLSPRFLLMCYDGGVYTVSDKHGSEVVIDKAADAHVLNELQYLKAGQNIYYSAWNDRERVQKDFAQVSLARPKRWYEVVVWVPHDETPEGTRYRRATENERATAQHTLVSTSALHPAPSRWLSKLRFRTPPQTYSDGSSLGYVRKQTWLRNPRTRTSPLPRNSVLPRRLPRRDGMFVYRRDSRA